MPFSDQYRTSQSIRLRFCHSTNEIVKYDMFQFNQSSLGTFLNTIIRNFYEQANTSINMRINEYQADLEKLLRPTLLPTSKATELIETMSNVKKQDLLNLLKIYDLPDKNCKSFSHRLQNDLYKEFTDPNSDFEENNYYRSLAEYIKKLIEEYAHLPFIEREKIFFKNYFDTINTAIADTKQLLITTSNGKVYPTLPLKIMSDPLSTAHYLIGYSYPFNQNKKSMYPVSYKIVSIKNIKITKSKSAFLTKAEKEILATSISKKGVQFLVSDYAEICIRFSKSGLKCFNQWLHLRPEPITLEKEKESNNYIAFFHCSINQAYAYFFKFGAKIEILSPISLRKHFKTQYQNAIKHYVN